MVVRLRCLVCPMISSSGTPLRKAVVTKPARRPCGLTGSANVPFSPARAARFNRIWRTASGLSRAVSTPPPRLTLRKTGPAVISAATSHACRAVTGQVSSDRPRGMAISAPSPSLSVLDRSIRSFRPSLVQVTSATSRPTSSERRRAPAKPIRNSARSRAPARSGPHARLSFLISAIVSAAARRGGVPCLRPMPRRVGRIAAMVSGSELYNVALTIQETAKTRWRAICADCAGGIDSLVELLQGRFSKGVMERLCRQEGGLFPRPSDIRFTCSCPDHASMCKHVAAVLYGVGARLDRQPELLFRLRAVDETELVAGLDTALPLSKTGPAAGKVLDTDDMSALFGLDLAAAEVPAAGKPSDGSSAARARRAFVIARRNGFCCQRGRSREAYTKTGGGWDASRRAGGGNASDCNQEDSDQACCFAAGAGGHRGSPNQITCSEGGHDRKGGIEAGCYEQDCRSRRRRSSSSRSCQDPRIGRYAPPGEGGSRCSPRGRGDPCARTWEAARFQPQDGDSSRTETKAGEMVVIDADRPHLQTSWRQLTHNT